jgi:hypothetical protein
VTVWGGHSCLLLLTLGLFCRFVPDWELSEANQKQHHTKINTNGSGQECPLHTNAEKATNISVDSLIPRIARMTNPKKGGELPFQERSARRR